MGRPARPHVGATRTSTAWRTFAAFAHRAAGLLARRVPTTADQQLLDQQTAHAHRLAHCDRDAPVGPMGAAAASTDVADAKGLGRNIGTLAPPSSPKNLENLSGYRAEGADKCPSELPSSPTLDPVQGMVDELCEEQSDH